MYRKRPLGERIREIGTAQEVNGIYFNPSTEMAEFQFQMDGEICLIHIPLPEILKSEIWFIKLRESLSSIMNQREENSITD
jgi:hypothetical protein